VIVKDVYGGFCDVCPVNTCEAGLRVSYDVLFTLPFTGRGSSHEQHMPHQAAYGLPFPPEYAGYQADRDVTAGEPGFHAQRPADPGAILACGPGPATNATGSSTGPYPCSGAWTRKGPWTG